MAVGSAAGICPAPGFGKVESFFCRGDFCPADLSGVFGSFKPDNRPGSVFGSRIIAGGAAFFRFVFFREADSALDSWKAREGGSAAYSDDRRICFASGLLFLGRAVFICVFLRHQL